MDVFFVVTTAAVVVLTTLVAVVLWRLERVLRHVEHVAAQVSAESDTVREDLAELRGSIRQGTGRIRAFLLFFKKLALTYLPNSNSHGKEK